MKKGLLAQILIISFGVSVYSQKTQASEFNGVFQDSFIHCSTYHINPDFAFKHRFGGEERNGAWKYIGKTKIRLFAPGSNQETVFLPVNQNDGRIVYTKIKIPGIPAFSKIFSLQNDSICAPNKKGKTGFCYQKIEPDSGQDISKSN